MSASTREGGGRTLRRIGRLVRKEVSTILRDRRTIITLVLMPLLLYPLLSIVFRGFLLASSLEVPKEPTYRVNFYSLAEVDAFRAQVQQGERLLARRPQAPGARPWKQLAWEMNTYSSEDTKAALLGGHVDLAIRVPGLARGPEAAPARAASYACEIVYVENSARSREIKEYVERCLAAANNDLAAHLLRVHAPGSFLLDPRPEALAQPESKEKVSLSVLVPLILILMTITGAVYPAIDLTAGERERGTLEILVAAPIPRLGLLFSKYLSVVTVAVLTGVVNLVAMTATLLLTPGLGQLVFGASGLSAVAVVQVFFLLLLFAAFFSAVLLTVTSFARSFKEAQAYLIPLMLVSLAPGIVSLFPGVRLDGPRVVVPLLNIVLLTRDVFLGEAQVGTAALVVLTTLVYAAAAIALAARIFGAEAVLYNEQAAWSDLVRRPPLARATPTVSSALLCLALMFPTSFVVVGVLGTSVDLPEGPKMAWRLLANLLLFCCFPLAVAWLRRVQPATAFRLTHPGIRGWVAAVLFGLCLWPFAPVLNEGLKALHLDTLSKLASAAVQGQFERWRGLSVVALVLCQAVAPAVLEELFFRGYLFSALWAAGTARTAIVGSALFFGLFHLIGAQVLVVEWGVTSTLLGLLLGWLSWRTGSVVPGMILHALHNSCLLLLAYYEPVLVREGWIAQGQETVPVLWLVVAGIGCVLAAAWMALACRGKPEAPPA